MYIHLYTQQTRLHTGQSGHREVVVERTATDELYIHSHTHTYIYILNYKKIGEDLGF